MGFLPLLTIERLCQPHFPRVPQERSIVYYTGVALEPWGPERLETGLGGSETAALMLAACWANDGKSGREVAIYLRMTPLASEASSPNASDASVADGNTGSGAHFCSVVPERTWRGVRLLDVSTFNPSDDFDTLVVWRSWEVLDQTLSAQLLLVDMHDMPWQLEISPARMRKVGPLRITRLPSSPTFCSVLPPPPRLIPSLNSCSLASQVDRLMLKSDFQRVSLPEKADALPASVVPNGVDGELIEQVKAEVKAEAEADVTAAAGNVAVQLRLLYTSSYDRGLEYMLRYGWPLIREALPNAVLHVYYGWRTHELLHAASAWRDEMKQLLASYGESVVEHGRVGQPELLRAKARAHLLYYVGDWPEIDCIAVREAAMLGCIPLTSSVAVFGDAAKDYVVRVPGDPKQPSTQQVAARRAIEMLRQYQRTGSMPSVDTPTLREETWARVAGRWLEIIERGALHREVEDSYPKIPAGVFALHSV